MTYHFSRQFRLDGAAVGLIMSIASIPTTALSPSVALAQQAGALPVVGINAAASREGLIDSVDAFLSEMEMLGYRDGETVRYEFRFADGNVDLQEPYAMELVDLAPDAILTVGPVTLPILKEMTSTIPIVVGFSPPATLAEHVANFDAPEGNITGCTFEAIGFRPLVDEAARLTRELLPEATTIGYLQNNNANAESNVQNINEAGASVGLSVMARLTEANDEVLPAFEALIAEGVDLIVVAGGVRNLAALPQLGEASLAAGMPTIHGSASATSQGGLIAVGNDQVTPMRSCAHLVDRVLGGAAPGDLPVVAHEGILLRVNLAVAGDLGLTVPQSILDRASDVISE